MINTLKKDQYSGIKFYDNKMDIYEVLGYSEHYKGYLLSKNGVLNGMYDIEQVAYIDYMLSKQNKIIEHNNNYIEQQRQEQIKEEQQKIEYENVYGYLDNKTALQKGKILKTLNKKTNYYSNNEFIGNWTRKEFLYNMIDKGYELEHKTNISYWNKQLEEKIKANEYILIASDNSYYEITKTEYDYAIYLINNIINKVA